MADEFDAMMAELDQTITSTAAANTSTSNTLDDDFESIFGGDGGVSGSGDAAKASSMSSSSSASAPPSSSLTSKPGFRSSYEKDDFNAWLKEGLDESSHSKRRTGSVASDGGFLA